MKTIIALAAAALFLGLGLFTARDWVEERIVMAFEHGLWAGRSESRFLLGTALVSQSDYTVTVEHLVCTFPDDIKPFIAKYTDANGYLASEIKGMYVVAGYPDAAQLAEEFKQSRGIEDCEELVDAWKSKRGVSNEPLTSLTGSSPADDPITEFESLR